MVYSTRRFVLCLNLVLICSCVFFSHFSIAITSLGEERANLSAFRTFVRFVHVWFYRFPLPLGVWKGPRFVIVALPGLFSYVFFFHIRTHIYTHAHTHTPTLTRTHIIEKNCISLKLWKGPALRAYLLHISLHFILKQNIKKKKNYCSCYCGFCGPSRNFLCLFLGSSRFKWWFSFTQIFQ